MQINSRMKSSGSRETGCAAAPEMAACMNRRSRGFRYFFFVFLLTLLLAALLFLQLENSGLMRCYCCSQACVLLLSALGNSTLARAFLACPPELLSLAADIGFIARSFFFLSLAAWLILAPYQPSKGYRRCLFGFLSLAATSNDGFADRNRQPCRRRDRAR